MGKDVIPQGVDIISVEAKDLYLANTLLNNNKVGYNVRYTKGDNIGKLNYKKFINTLDFSLEYIYWESIRDKYIKDQPIYYYNDILKLSSKHRYTLDIINVTFEYSVKMYNKKSKDFYVKLGYDVVKEDLIDNVLIVDNELIAIVTNEKVENVQQLNNKFFFYDKDSGEYKAKNNIPTVMSSRELRQWCYCNVFKVDGRNYVRYKRSSGSSRVGKCLFIDERLYPPIHEWEKCGLDIQEGQDIDLASFEAYISLTLSSIIDVIKIDPKNILVIDDYDSVFKDVCIDTVDENGVLVTREKEVTISNSIWDGQSIGDKSLFGKYEDYGMLLIRNKFFKTCMQNGNVQGFFRDHGITSVSQLNGFTLAENIEDVKLITTPNSIKYVKFGSLEQWLNNIDCNFGVVKHEKKTHHLNGNCVNTHYQLLSTLQMNQKEVKEFLDPPLQYLKAIRDDDSVLRNHIRYSGYVDGYELPFLDNNDITYRLLGLNKDFARTEIYRKFKKDIYDAYVKDMRRGHVLVQGNYSTLCGNPIEMLFQAIGKFDGTPYMEKGTIHTTRFVDGEEILGSRSPHVCAGCILLTKNKRYELIDKYMNATSEIVYINSINENILQQLSGADFDSDTMLITNNIHLIKSAKKNYDLFKVSTCSVNAKKLKRKYTNEEKYDLDYKTSNNLIGEIVNLAAILNSKMFEILNSGGTEEDIMQLNYDVCQLNVLSGLQIDAAKKEFDLNFDKELKTIRNRHNLKDDDKKNIKPYFFYYILSYKDLLNTDHDTFVKQNTTMDLLEEVVNKSIRGKEFRFNTPNEQTLKFYEILKDTREDETVSKKLYNKVYNLLKDYNSHVNTIYASKSLDNIEKRRMFEMERYATLRSIRNVKLNNSTIIYLLKQLDTKKNNYLYKRCFNMLFCTQDTPYMEVIQESQERLPRIRQDDYGNINLLGSRYKKVGDF